MRRLRMQLTAALPRRRVSIAFDARHLLLALLWFAIGVELLVLVTWTPDTLDVWFRPDRAGYGDFPGFYRAAEDFRLYATYSPGLTVLLHPLTWLGMRAAFAIYTGVNVAALLATAWIAQRPLRSTPARLAVALGILALPQAHWALRVGHFTPVLGLLTLSGLLLARRRPVEAGLLLGALALKPQYVLLPLVYLLWTRNWRALAAAVGSLAALAAAGVVAAFVMMGFDALSYVSGYYVHAVEFVANHVTVGQLDEPYVQAWQYSWYGFLISIGLEPNPLIAADLMAVTLAALVLVWWRCTPAVAAAATVLGMLLLTPHVTFYNWCLLGAGAALLLRAEMRPRWLIPATIAGLAIAAGLTQQATPFPIPLDVFREPATRGPYLLQPAALAALAAFALAGGRRAASAEADIQAEAVSSSISPGDRPAAGILWIASVSALVAGVVAAAWFSGAGPFAVDPYFTETQVVRALPADFPLPAGASMRHAGSGDRLPYRIEWMAPGSVSEVAGLLRRKLDGGAWDVVGADSAASSSFRSTRSGDGPAVLAEVNIEPAGAGSRIRLEFSPLPPALVSGYDRWLEGHGLVVHALEPSSPDIPSTR